MLDEVIINYTNWRGETADRRIAPQRIVFMSTPHHPERQWLLDAIDLGKKELRTFAMKDIHSWNPVEKKGGGS
jgi:hypothetical protein